MNVKKAKDLLVKLHYPCPKDIFILRNGWFMVGEKSLEESYGLIVGVLNPNWLEVFKDFLPGDIYIPDIDSLKKAIEQGEGYKNLYRLITPEEEDDLIESFENHLSEVDNVEEWSFFVNLPNFKETILDKKSIYNILIENGERKITVGKPTFPVCTVRTIPNYQYNIQKDDMKNLYHLYTKFEFSHYNLFCFYDAVPMINIQDED